MALCDPAVLLYPSRLSTGENGISFFYEGPQALCTVLRYLGQSKLVHVSVAGSLVEGVAICVDRRFAEANPVGRQRGGAACHLQGGLHRRAIRHCFVDQRGAKFRNVQKFLRFCECPLQSENGFLHFRNYR